MIKHILRLSIAAFIIILAYDTINFYKTSSIVPREKQLVVVQPAVKHIEKKLDFEPFDYDLKGNPYLYGGLGAAAATGLGIFCYCLSSVCSKKKMSKEGVAKGNENLTIGEPEGGVYLNHFNVSSRPPSSIYLNYDSEKKKCDINRSSLQIGESTAEEIVYEAQNKIEIENLLEVSKENNSTPSVTRPLSRQETRGSLPDNHIKVSQENNPTLSVSRPISRQETKGSLFENLNKLEINNEIPECLAEEFRPECTRENSEVILGSRIILDGEVSYSKHSMTNDITMITLPEQIIAALTYLQSSQNPEPLDSPALTKDDLLNIELRLDKIENRINQIENVSKECVKRIEMAETEMVELHEQMYTVLTKIEQEQKPNYIIVSQMSAVDEAQDESTNDIVAAQRDSRTTGCQHEQDNTVNERLTKEMKNSQHQTINHQGDCPNPIELLDRPISQESGKLKSIGLEAMLERDVPRKSSTAPPKKANPKVPTHIVQPYKRSTFTATDSLSDIKKVSHRLMKGRNERCR